MKLPTDIFKVSLKKPALSEDEMKLEKRKLEIKRRFAFCYSRLNTVKALNENRKLDDMLILLEHLILDLLNLTLLICEKKEVKDLDTAEPGDILKEIPSREIKKLFNDNLSILKMLKNWNDIKGKKHKKELSDRVTSLSDGLYTRIHSFYKIEKKKGMATQLDEYKKRLRYQLNAAGVLIILIFIGFHAFTPAKLYFYRYQPVFGHTLFYKSGEELINALAKMYYGETGGIDPIQQKDGGVFLIPTDKRDHFYIPFFNIEYNDVRGRTLKVTLSFQKSVKPTKNLNVYLQDNAFAVVGSLIVGFDTKNPEEGVYQKVVELPEGVKSIRIVIYSLDGEGVFLPESIKIEQETFKTERESN